MIIAVNILLIAVVMVLLGAMLAGAIVTDRRSKRTTGGELHPSDAPLHRDLAMPRRHQDLGRRTPHRSATGSA